MKLLIVGETNEEILEKSLEKSLKESPEKSMNKSNENLVKFGKEIPREILEGTPWKKSLKESMMEA